MTRHDTARRVRLVVARELAIDIVKVKEDSEFRDGLKADSLDMVQLPAALEEEFGIQITDDEVDFCQTVATAIDVIHAKIENGGQP